MLWTLVQKAKANRKEEENERAKGEAEEERELKTRLLVMITPHRLYATSFWRGKTAVGGMHADMSMSPRSSSMRERKRRKQRKRLRRSLRRTRLVIALPMKSRKRLRRLSRKLSVVKSFPVIRLRKQGRVLTARSVSTTMWPTVCRMTLVRVLTM